MTSSPRRTLRRSLLLFPPIATLALLAPASVAYAQAAGSQEAVRDAGKHFQRGVALFNEADYAGALAEFRRANELAPNAAVLYNIGQTQFQLRSYAAALGSFERYVAEAGANAEHRTEAQTAIETLRARVGKIDVTAPDGSEITIDDEVVGKTPIPPVLAAVGKRKVIATKDGRSSPPRFVEVSAGEVVKTELRVEESAPSNPSTVSTQTTSTTPASQKNYTPAIALWGATGALTAGSAIVGILAIKKGNDLDDARTTYNPNATVASRQAAIADAHSTAKTFAVVSDVLIPLAAVAGAAAIYFTIVPPTKTTTSSASLRIKLSPGGAGLAGTF